MRLKGSDKIAGMSVVFEGKAEKNEQLLVVMENGFGKRTPLKEYRIQGRGGSGVKAAKITAKTGQIVTSFIVNAKRENEDLVIISDKGQVIRLPLKSVSVLGRTTQGVHLMRFKATKDGVASVTFV
jgi:DNA gyrase subunit A